jgi:hypothetical protein
VTNNSFTLPPLYYVLIITSVSFYVNKKGITIVIPF